MVGNQRQFAPHPQLASYIKCMWVHERDFRQIGGVFQILPDSYVELSFSSGAQSFIGDAAGGVPVPAGCVVGLLDRPLTLAAAGVVRTLGVRFYAWGFAPLFGCAPSWPVAPALLGDRVFAQLSRSVQRALTLGDDRGAVDEAQAWLLACAERVTLPPDDVRAAAEWLFAQRGAARIAALEDVCNLSRRQIERRFQQVVGISPKALARKMRFEQVLYALWERPTSDLAWLAADYGYADQSHLAREFRAFSDETPGRFTARLLAADAVRPGKLRIEAN